jgi:hypothetical protein
VRLFLAWLLLTPALDTLARSETSVREDLEQLCSPEMAGRVSLSAGAEKAAAYIERAFAAAGLTPGAEKQFQQHFPLVAYEPDRERTTLSIVRSNTTKRLVPTQDFRGGYWERRTLTAAVVFAGYAITAPEYGYDDFAGIDAKGKIVLAFEHEPQENDPASKFNGVGHTWHGSARAKLENALRHGAVALLVVSDPLRQHTSPFDAPRPAGLRATAPRQALVETSIPVFQISDQIAADLLQQAPADVARAIDRDLRPASKDLAGTRIAITTAPANFRRGLSSNVIGLLEGSDPALRRETIVIDAHYDALGVQNGRLYAGANDNASGTVAVMELARRFAHAAAKPRRSILFVVFGSEEEQMLGSYYYVAHPTRPLSATRAVLNLDMIAHDEAHIGQSEGVVDIPADTRNEMNVVGGFYSPDLAAAIAKANESVKLDLSTKYDRDHHLNTLFRCDHLPFLLHGIPAVWIFAGFHPGYHEPSDSVENLNFEKLDKVIRLTYDTATALANADGYPKFRP